MADLRIIDVSNHQGKVDWPKVLASGVAGGICKASEGQSFHDATFKANWSALGSAGVVRGAYHFARPDASSGASQANMFLSCLSDVNPRDLLVLDIEEGSGNLSGWALEFLQTIERTTGALPWVYSYGPFLRQSVTDPGLARYPLWLAAYQSRPPAPPKPWGNWRLWQHTDAAAVPGVKGKVDESVGSIPDRPGRPVPVPAPSEVEVQGMKITAGNIPVAALDDQGHGWVSIQAPMNRLLFLACQGSAPGRDKGYWPPVAWDVNDSGAETVVTLFGQPHEGTVVYYSVLEEA